MVQMRVKETISKKTSMGKQNLKLNKLTYLKNLTFCSNCLSAFLFRDYAQVAELDNYEAAGLDDQD